MAEIKEVTQNDLYAARIFFNSALPLVKVIVQDVPKIGKKFVGKNFIFQVSARYDKAEKGKMATYFDVKNGEFTVHVSEVCDKPDIEFIFPDLHKFILFFSGRGMPLPKMTGIMQHFGVFLSLMQALLKMAGLLQAKDAPANEADQQLLVKLYFYLLANGISQLNKAGQEKIHTWALESPDRAYAFAVNGHDDLASYIRVFTGNSRAGHGAYPRCKPFLTLRFDTPMHALDILMGKGDMIEYIASCFLTVEGAPEFASIVGEFMFVVGDYAKGLYLDWPESAT
ncbi:MAG: hypothetical protein RRZ24_05405 [Clostridia bacterium]